MDVIITENWNKYLIPFDDEDKDIYFTEEYVKLYASSKDTAKCVICTEGEKILLFPFLERSIGDYKDFETVYGYGGPVSNSSDREWIKKAANEMDRLFKEEGYLCGFIRFHPLLDNKRFFTESTEVLYDRETVIINTSTDRDTIWKTQINSKNRNMIRKAEKNGLSFKAEHDFASMKEFIVLYNDTMRRLHADSFYYFSNEYYLDFIDRLKGQAFLGTVRKKEKLICAGLFMYSKQYGHYHLAGSDRNYSGMGENNLLLWEAACELNKMGIGRFHLGGGYDSTEDNSLLKFKKAFGKGKGYFYIGKKIFDYSGYKTICDEWKKNNPEKVRIYGNRLLMYRY